MFDSQIYLKISLSVTVVTDNKMLDGINEMLLKILITGEPGVGKTQLIDSFLGSLELV